MRYYLAIGFCLLLRLTFCQEVNWDCTYFGADVSQISDVFSCVAEDEQGTIWLGTNDAGIVRYDGYDWSYFHYRDGDSIGLPSNQIECLLQDAFTNLMIVGTSDGAALYRTGVWQKNLLRGHRILSITQNDSLSYWFGTDAGLLHFDIAGNDFKRFLCPVSPAVPVNRSENAVESLLFDESDQKRLWVGTQYGLKSFDIQRKEFTHHPNPPKWHDHQPQYQQYETMDMHYFKGLLYLGGGASGGVLSFDGTNWKQYLFKGGIQADPYIGNFVNALFPIRDEKLYTGATTNFGFVDFNIGQLVAIDQNEIRQIGEIEDILLSRNGLVWLAGRNGVVRARPDGELVDPYPPVITQVEVNGELMHFSAGQGLRIPEKQVNLTISFSSSNPVFRENLRYRWMLKGFHEDWTQPLQTRTAEFTGLRKGNYEFIVQCGYEDSQWIQGKRVRMHIMPYWYQSTAVFIFSGALTCLLLVCLGRLISRPMRRRIKEQSDLEKRTLHAELTALRSHMNPHFIFNSLNSIYNFILDKENELAAEYLSKFSSLMRMVLSHSQANSVSLEDELTIIRIYLELEQLRFNGKFKFEIKTNLKSSPSEIYIPPMLIQPYAENAIWHGFMHKREEGHLRIFIEQKEQERIRIFIEDDGIGRDKSRKISPKGRASFGIKITEERLASFALLHNAPFNVNIIDMKDTNGEACGTKVILDVYALKSAVV